MRVVHLSHDMEAIGRLFSPDHALEAARDRRDRTYDPALADLFVAHGRELVRPARARSSRGTPCSPSSPSRAACWTASELDDALTVAADFIDLKSPYMGGHSRRCAELAADAARVLGLADDAVTDAPPRRARARLRHHRGAELDLGQARPAHADGVRPGRASPDADRADAAPLAGARRPEPGRLRAPREVRRVRLPQARAGRRRRSRRVRAGRDGDLRRADHRAGRPSAVLARRTRPPSFAGSSRRACSSLARAAPCSWPRATASRARPRGKRPQNPGGLTRREVDVLRLAAQGPHDARRSPIGSSSRPRPPTTTSSTSTARSASRPAPPPLSGRCSTPSSSKPPRASAASRLTPPGWPAGGSRDPGGRGARRGFRAPRCGPVRARRSRPRRGSC